MSKHHENFRVLSKGLVTHKQAPYIRASPDGIAECECHPPRLVEVKCPFTAKDMTIEQGMRKDHIKYLKKNGTKYELIETATEGYLSQVQCAMAVTELNSCDFIVFNAGEARELAIVEVEFDAKMWDQLFQNAKLFFRNHLAPAIMARSQSYVTESEIQIDSETESDHELVIKTEIQCQNPTQSNDLPDGADCPTYCYKCTRLLPEEQYIHEDHSNASVCCDRCDQWYCWPCARYTTDEEELNIDWFCPPCIRSGEIVF